MLIIDPDMNGARIYTEYHVSYILGDPNDVCINLAHRIFTLKGDTLVQTIIPRVDTTGIGRGYADCLQRMGITFKEIKYKPYNIFLPVTC